MNLAKFLKRNIKKEIFFGILILLVIVWSVILYYFPPQTIVNLIGINNSYVLIVILAFLGGTSILFPFPYYLFVITFAVGGANPILLGICSGLGVILGESTSYYIGYHSRAILSNRYQKIFNKLYKNFNKTKNTILISMVLFLYGAFIPLPNDLFILPLGAARYNYWKLIIPLGLGNIVFGTILAYGGIYGFNLFWR